MGKLRGLWNIISQGHTAWEICQLIVGWKLVSAVLTGAAAGIVSWLDDLQPIWVFFSVVGGIALGLVIYNQIDAWRIKRRLTVAQTDAHSKTVQTDSLLPSLRENVTKCIDGKVIQYRFLDIMTTEYFEIYLELKNNSPFTFDLRSSRGYVNLNGRRGKDSATVEGNRILAYEKAGLCIRQSVSSQTATDIVNAITNKEKVTVDMRDIELIYEAIDEGYEECRASLRGTETEVIPGDAVEPQWLSKDLLVRLLQQESIEFYPNRTLLRSSIRGTLSHELKDCKNAWAIWWTGSDAQTLHFFTEPYKDPPIDRLILLDGWGSYTELHSQITGRSIEQVRGTIRNTMDEAIKAGVEVRLHNGPIMEGMVIAGEYIERSREFSDDSWIRVESSIPIQDPENRSHIVIYNKGKYQPLFKSLYTHFNRRWDASLETKLKIETPVTENFGDSGRRFMLPILNRTNNQIEGCQVKLTVLGFDIPTSNVKTPRLMEFLTERRKQRQGTVKGHDLPISMTLGRIPIERHLQWADGSVSMTIPRKQTERLEVASYDSSRIEGDYNRALWLAYAGGDDFRKEHGLSRDYGYILVLTVLSQNTAPLHVVGHIHKDASHTTLTLLGVKAQCPNIDECHQLLVCHTGDCLP